MRDDTQDVAPFLLHCAAVLAWRVHIFQCKLAGIFSTASKHVTEAGTMECMVKDVRSLHSLAVSLGALCCRSGIETHGIVEDADGKKIYAYEVDGRGGVLSGFDDPNMPSLLGLPLLGYKHYDPQVGCEKCLFLFCSGASVKIPLLLGLPLLGYKHCVPSTTYTDATAKTCNM